MSQQALPPIVIVIIVIAAIAYWAIQNPDSAVQTGENLVNSGEVFLEQVCPLDEKILDSIDAAFIQTLEDEKSKDLAEKIIKNQASDCDKRMFFEILDEDSRKRIHWLDFTCNVKDCLGN